MTTNGMRRIRFGKYGLAEDPRGLHATWTERGRTFLVDIVDTYRREMPACIMLKTRHFNGEVGPDVAAGAVMVLIREYETAE